MTELEQAIMRKDPEPEAVTEVPEEAENEELAEVPAETLAAEIAEIVEGTSAKAESAEAPEKPEEHIEEYITEHDENETAEPVLPEAPPPEALIQESSDAVRRMTEEVQRENGLPETGFPKPQEEAPAQPVRRKRRRKYVYIGTFSAALSLIVMGIAMTVSLFSPEGILGAFKIAPVMLVFLGLETLFAVIANRSARLKFSVKSIIITVLLLSVTFAMSLISMNNSVSGGERAHAQERLHNILAQEIKRKIPSDNIRDVELELMLFGEDPAEYREISDMLDGDCVNIKISFASAQDSLFEFAADCRKIMDSLERLRCTLNKVSFTADDGGDRYSLSLNWLYQSELTARELVPLVGYYGENVTFDIPDLDDDSDD